MTQYLAKLKPVTILERLEKAKSKKTKIKVIKDAWDSDADEFFIGIEMAFNPSLDFGLTSVPYIDEPDDGDPGSFTFDDFLALTKKLRLKELEGEEAKKAITDAAMIANISEWNNWYRRILLKTLAKHLPKDIIKETLIELTTA